MSASLTNPIYEHSGETKKIDPVAAQASVKEDLEQRRRQLDGTGETRKIIVAKEISNMIETCGSQVHLKQTPFPAKKETLLEHTLSGALETGKSFIQTATQASKDAVDAITLAATGAATTVSHVAGEVADSVSHAGKDAVNALKLSAEDASLALSNATKYVSHAGQDAANAFSSATKSAAEFVSHTASDAKHTAVTFAEKVGHKTREIAEISANKAHEVADNISHFTALVGVLAAEEKERTRRLNDGDEAFAVLNALKVSELIRGIGPSFYRQEPPPNLLYSAKLLEEIERRWRLTSPYSSIAAKNAHSLGKLVSSNWQDFIPRRHWIILHINNIEEKERTRRLNDSDEVYAMLNAFAMADLLHELGWPLYHQEDTLSISHAAYATTLLEENERRWRIRTQKLLHVEDTAHTLMDVVANNIDRFNFSTRQAAHVVNEFATKLGNETLQIASVFTQNTRELVHNAAQRVHTLAGELSHFASLMYIIALEENERATRLNDPDEIYAIQNAWNQSALIRELEEFYEPGLCAAKYPTRLLEELERRNRIFNDDKHTRARAHAIAEIVTVNIAKFERAHEYAAELERKREVAARSRLNPAAAPFVPAQQKVEPAPIAQVNVAAGAQR